MTHACGCHGHDTTPAARGAITKVAPPLAASQTVADVVAAHPELLETLKSLGVNHCCGGHLTLTEAAASAGIPLDRLLKAFGTVLVDVRDDIRRGVEPFARIMAAVKALAVDEVLVLRAPFEPIPLYDVLGKRGFERWTECRGAEDWWVTFYRGAAAETSSRTGRAEPAAAASRTIDVRGLEPPQPMVRVLESLDALPAGGELVVLHERRPMFLYPQLDERGFVHETDEPAPGVVRIRIRYADGGVRSPKAS